jgi:hypothetical protein
MATGTVYESVSTQLWSANIDYLGDDIYCALLDDTYTPDQFTDDTWADCSAAEVSGPGYTAGGQLLTGKSISDTGTGTVALLCANPVWTTATLSGVRYIVFYDNSAADALLLYVDLLTDFSVVTADLTVIIPAGGLISAYTY